PANLRRHDRLLRCRHTLLCQHRRRRSVLHRAAVRRFCAAGASLRRFEGTSCRASRIMGGGERIVSFLPSATEMVYALGLGDRLAGVTHECDWPPDAASKPVVVRSVLPTPCNRAM